MATVYSVVGDQNVYRETYPALVNIDGGFSPWVTLASAGWVNSGITLDGDDNVYVFTSHGTGQTRVYKITPAGSVTLIYDDNFALSLDGPGGIDWNPVDGLLYVWEANTNFVSMTTAGGSVTLIDVGYLAGARPSGIRCTPDGAVWFVNAEGSLGRALNRYDPGTDTFAEAHGVGSIITGPCDPLPRAGSKVWYSVGGVGHAVTPGFVDSTIGCMTNDPVGVYFDDMRAWFRNGVGVASTGGDYYQVGGGWGCLTYVGSTTLASPDSFAVAGLARGWRVGSVGWSA